MAEQRKKAPGRKSDTGFVALVSGVIVLAVILAAILGTGIYVAARKTVFPNITVAGVDVGGMSYEQARSTLLSSSPRASRPRRSSPPARAYPSPATRRG